MLIFDKDTSKDVLRNFLCFYENILNFVTTKKKVIFDNCKVDEL